MAFAVFTDGSANLPRKMLGGIQLLPNNYSIDGVPQEYRGNIDEFDGHSYFEGLKNGRSVRTSLLNTELFLRYFEPVLSKGTDVICVVMSSGISGTFNAAKTAAAELMERYKNRFVHIVDSLGCGFGSGLLAVKADQLSRQGMDAREASGILDEEVVHCCQYFTVQDLNFLKRTGRVSGMTALIGTALNIKPILYGDSTGHIVASSKVRGRKRAIEGLVKKYEEKRIDSDEQRICISHGDCLEDAQTLAEMVQAVTPGVPITICMHEPFSGSHVGPGMLGLFFRGKER